MLDIGVQRGGSLDLWRSHFGAGSRIVGLDVDPACLANGKHRAGVSILDQVDTALLRRIVAECGPFGIVLDDGRHTMNQMIRSFETLYPR